MIDCLVVGGGVIGLSLAYELAGRGFKVEVVDRREMGKEASWAGAGILPPANRQTAVDPLDQLRGLSHELHERWARDLQAETGIDTGYSRCGGVSLARSRGEAATLIGEASMLQDLGIAIRVILHRHLAIGRLDRRCVRVARNAQQFIKIGFGSHYKSTRSISKRGRANRDGLRGTVVPSSQDQARPASPLSSLAPSSTSENSASTTSSSSACVAAASAAAASPPPLACSFS